MGQSRRVFNTEIYVDKGRFSIVRREMECCKSIVYALKERLGYRGLKRDVVYLG
jgi:hypothetical protein